jgi:hypothetical protein
MLPSPSGDLVAALAACPTLRAELDIPSTCLAVFTVRRRAHRTVARRVVVVAG